MFAKKNGNMIQFYTRIKKMDPATRELFFKQPLLSIENLQFLKILEVNTSLWLCMFVQFVEEYRICLWHLIRGMWKWMNNN